MGLADAARLASKPRRSECTVARIRALLDDATRAELDEVLADPTVTTTGIAKALDGIGHHILPGTISRHRNGGCACDRPG